MAAPARKSGGASAPLRPANQHDLPFEVIEISPVGLKNLVGQFKVCLPSGLILRCNLVVSRSGELSVFPAANRTGHGNSQPVVEFATPKVKQRWEELVFEALAPHLHHFNAAREAVFDGRF